MRDELVPASRLDPPVHGRLDPVRDALRGLGQLSDGPVGGVALGDVAGLGVVDQPLGVRRSASNIPAEQHYRVRLETRDRTSRMVRKTTSGSDQGGNIQTSGQVRQRRGDYGQLLAPKPTSVLLSTQSGPAERGAEIVFTPRYGQSCILTTTDRTSVLCTVKIPAPRVLKRAEHGRVASSSLSRANIALVSSGFRQKWIKNDILEKDKKTTTAS